MQPAFVAASQTLFPHGAFVRCLKIRLGEPELRERHRRHSKISERGETAQCHVGGNPTMCCGSSGNTSANTMKLQDALELTQATWWCAFSLIVGSQSSLALQLI